MILLGSSNFLFFYVNTNVGVRIWGMSEQINGQIIHQGLVDVQQNNIYFSIIFGKHLLALLFTDCAYQ